MRDGDHAGADADADSRRRQDTHADGAIRLISTSPFDRYLRVACGVTIALNLAMAALPLVNHCWVVFVGPLWLLVGALFAIVVLVPALIGRFVGPFGRRNLAWMGAAIAVMALAILAMSVLGGENLGHCIA